MKNKIINASIIGANGYTGLELLNILSAHDNVCIRHAVSVSNQGTLISDMYPSLSSALSGISFEGLDVETIAKDSDVVFSCLPHAKSAEVCGEFYDKGIKVIDLSADFRYKSLDQYQKTYNITHPRQDLNQKAVYGLPELYHDQISTSSLIGNPGCYTTCSILALYPLLKEGLIDTDNIIIDAKSGVSGAGRKAETPYLYTEVADNFKAYAVTNHRHTSEIEQELSLAASKKVELSFTPHLLPIPRGILSTIYLKLNSDFTKPHFLLNEGRIKEAYRKYYKDQPFVIVRDVGLPTINSVKYSNYIQIGFELDKRLDRLIVVACLDNLVKGASGQAVQNMNIMFGLDQTTGLKFVARHL